MRKETRLKASIESNVRSRVCARPICSSRDRRLASDLIQPGASSEGSVLMTSAEQPFPFVPCAHPAEVSHDLGGDRLCKLGVEETARVRHQADVSNVRRARRPRGIRSRRQNKPVRARTWKPSRMPSTSRCHWPGVSRSRRYRWWDRDFQGENRAPLPGPPSVLFRRSG